MTKITFNEEILLKEKDFENKLWEAFWSYQEELGLDDPVEKEKKLRLADGFIPDFASFATEWELYFDYPIVHLLLTSLHLGKNILHSDEIKPIMDLTEPDNNSKLALFVGGLKEKGVIWSLQQYR